MKVKVMNATILLLAIGGTTVVGATLSTSSIQLASIHDLREFRDPFLAAVNKAIETNGVKPSRAASETDWVNEKMYKDAIDKTIHHTKDTSLQVLKPLTLEQAVVLRYLFKKRLEELAGQGAIKSASFEDGTFSGKVTMPSGMSARALKRDAVNDLMRTLEQIQSNVAQIR